jgi:hypothetical protein
MYPLVVPFCVMAAGDLRGRRFLVAFAAVSVVGSRAWLQIGHFPFAFDTLREFPAQRLFMGTGLWTSWEMYLVQLGAIALACLLLLGLAAKRPLWPAGRPHHSTSSA